MSESTSVTTTDDEKPCNGALVKRCSIPIRAEGPTTFAYQRALSNRIADLKLSEGGPCDVKRYMPIFIHDVLVFPASLANLVGKGSPEEIINRMTPALLPGAHAHVDQECLQPVLVRSNAQSHVQGMLIFGQGKGARNAINQHYRHFARRRKVEVEVDIKVPVDPMKKSSVEDAWQLERRTIRAYAWIRSKLDGCAHSKALNKCDDWTLKAYLDGTLLPQRPIRVSTDGKGDEDKDGYIGRDIWTYDESQSEQKPERELVYGGSGGLDYERADYFTGW